MLKLNNQRGDTIVEVMMALAILGLAFGIAYATANQSLQNTRNSQEHSEALQYLASQVELVRADALDANLYNNPGTAFCMTPSGPNTGALIKPVTAACTIPPVNYQLSITYNPATVNGVNQDVFTFDATWPGLGSFGQQDVKLQYKVHQIP